MQSYRFKFRVGIAGGGGLNPPAEFVSTDAHF